MAGQLLLGLSLLIVLHEWGHYFPAKLFKTRVEKFYLFFDPWFSLVKKKIGETEYGIGWLPLGGYVKIAGMIDESMDKEQMAGPPQPWEFRSKPAWQRLIIMLGGVTVNLILGFLIYAMILFTWGRDVADPASFENGSYVDSLLFEHGFEQGDIVLDYDNKVVKNYKDLNLDIMLFGVRDIKVKKQSGEVQDLRIPEDITNQMLERGTRTLFQPRFYIVADSILKDTPAEKAGILKNDSIVAFNGKEVTFWDEFTAEIRGRKNEAITLDLFRGGEKMQLSVTTDSLAKIGMGPKASFGNFHEEHFSYGFFESIPAGIQHGWRTLRANVNSFKYVFTEAGSKQVGSFIAFAQAYGPTWEWRNFWNLTAMISIILAFMNILPIPALDGGHVMFLLYEMVTGKAPSQRFMEIAQMIGFFLLIGLILFAIKNDVVNYVLN